MYIRLGAWPHHSHKKQIDILYIHKYIIIPIENTEPPTLGTEIEVWIADTNKAR